MKPVTLRILASDILETNYSNFQDCAITRALRRAGYDNLCDAGLGILRDALKFINTHSDYYILKSRVKKMYRFKEFPDGEESSEPEDFEMVINLDV